MMIFARGPRVLIATSALAAALLRSTVVTAPAYAAPTPLASMAVTDGVTTGDELAVNGGSPVTLVLNGATSGDVSFAGCWAVFVDGEAAPGAPATPESVTWPAGASVDTVFTAVDLTPSVTTVYDIVVWNEFVDGRSNGDPLAPIVCDQDEDDTTVAFLTVEITPAVDPESMTLTGEAKLGSTVTVTAKVPGSLVGGDFDLWVCPDRTIYPDDDKGEKANGDCFGPLIQPRDGADAVTFLLDFDPVRDEERAEEAIEFWKNVCDQYFIVHDFSGGGHSNWIGPVDCTVTPELAATGVDDTASAISIGALAALLLGGTLVLVRRTMRVSAR